MMIGEALVESVTQLVASEAWMEGPQHGERSGETHSLGSVAPVQTSVEVRYESCEPV